MEKAYYVTGDEDNRFPYFLNMIITSREEWEEKVTKKIYENKEYWLKYFEENEKYISKKDAEKNPNNDFDEWVRFFVGYGVYFNEMQIDKYDDLSEGN